MQQAKKRANQLIDAMDNSARASKAIRSDVSLQDILHTCLAALAAKQDDHGQTTALKIIEAFGDLDTTSFSVLTTEDVHRVLGLTERRGSITKNPAWAGSARSAWWTVTLQRIHTQWNLRTENGKRVLIDSYLFEAQSVDASLVIFPGFHQRAVEVTAGNSLHGLIDYVIANADETAMLKSQENLLAGVVVAAQPTFLVIEAQSGDTLFVSLGQALGQMRAAQKASRAKRVYAAFWYPVALFAD
eukprot:TRINITY_DN3781_c0_g1_i1.p1 TRINITY_DN3781_c0_g1~~TRINITY_DN3781_c0_g1_i1.p1  ORF type:complete len:244 (+),score=27.42 TRINITY_DN3781_c0_g1_i1:610-1341(+)